MAARGRGRGRGTVTPLSSVFQAEEVRKAAERVEEAIAGKRKEVEQFREFISDNSNLINLVQKLPEELHHDVMVPFGKAAFFPGRLIHTNEFMVLLGEGYFAERTSKQTVDILKRRGKYLESNVNSAKAVIEDLKAEASFFGTTASELAEDLVEIREEISDDESDAKVLVSVPLEQGSDSFEGEVPNADDEYARIMARLDELEEEERAAERENDSDEEATLSADVDMFLKKGSSDLNPTESKGSEQSLEMQSKGGHVSNEEFLDQRKTEPQLLDQFNDSLKQFECLKMQSSERGEKSALEVQKMKHDYSSSGITPISSALKEDKQAHHLQSSAQSYDSTKAFTGSIIEHPVNLPMNPGQQSRTSSQVSSSQPSKPVSRFKMQRR